MADADITITGSRKPLDGSSLDTADCRVALSFRGATFSTAIAVLRLDDATLFDASQVNFHALCTKALGTPANEWQALAAELGARFIMPSAYSTIEQNLIKAAMLVVMWLEPALVSNADASLSDELHDEIIVDYSAREPTQRLIYFPPRALLDAATETGLKRLYDLHLLAQLSLRLTSTTIERYFVPLVVPGVRVDKFDDSSGGGRVYRAWRAIRDRMRERIQRTVRG